MLSILKSLSLNIKMVKQLKKKLSMNKKRVWTDLAWKDYIYWQTQDKKTLKRINRLLDDTNRQSMNYILQLFLVDTIIDRIKY